jgi:hypothetical protein
MVSGLRAFYKTVRGTSSGDTTVLARVVDAYGDTLEEIKAPGDGETIGMRTSPYVPLPGDYSVYFAEFCARSPNETQAATSTLIWRWPQLIAGPGRRCSPGRI